MKSILDQHNLQPQNKPKKLTELSILNPQTLIWSLQNLTSILPPSCMELGTGDRGVCWERRKAYKIEEETEKLVVKNQHTRAAENTFAKQVEDGSFRNERKRTGGGGGGGDIRTRSRR
jgi:hypothetical protein